MRWQVRWPERLWTIFCGENRNRLICVKGWVYWDKLIYCIFVVREICWELFRVLSLKIWCENIE